MKKFFHKKIFALILASVSLALCLTSCVHEELGIKLGKDGTGSIAATVALKKDVCEQLAALGGSDPFEGEETFEVEYDGEAYIAFTETQEYASFEEMEKALAEMTYDTDLFGDMPEDNEFDDEIGDDFFTDDVVISDPVTEVDPAEEADVHIFKSVEIKKDGSKYVFDATLNPLTGDLDGYDMSDIFKVGISVEMPAKVTAYKNGTVDGNKVTFDLSDMSKETELYAECKTASKAPAIIGIVLAVGAVAAFIVLKKRK